MAFKGFFQKILTSIIRSFAPPRRSMRALSRTGCWPHEVPPGAWLLANAAAHRRTPGFHRGRAGSSGSDCQERRSPPGPWLLANAAAYRRTSGLRRGARARSGIRLRRSSPPGSWVLASAAAHRRTSGLRRGAQARSGIRLQATRSPTGLLGVGQCCSSSSDARRSPRGMRARPGSGCRRRGAPPGSLVWPDAAAHRQTPGAPPAACGLGRDPAASDADLHRAPWCWPMLQLINARRALPAAVCRFFRIRLPGTQIPTGPLVVGQCCNSSTDTGRSPRGMRAQPGSGSGHTDLHRVPGCWPMLSLSTARALPAAPCWLGRDPAASDANLRPGSWFWPMLQLIDGGRALPGRLPVRPNSAAGNANVRPGSWLLANAAAHQRPGCSPLGMRARSGTRRPATRVSTRVPGCRQQLQLIDGHREIHHGMRARSGTRRPATQISVGRSRRGMLTSVATHRD